MGPLKAQSFVSSKGGPLLGERQGILANVKTIDGFPYNGPKGAPGNAPQKLWGGCVGGRNWLTSSLDAGKVVSGNS